MEAPDDGEAIDGCLTHELLLEDCELHDEVGIVDLMTQQQHLSSHRLLAWRQVEEETGLLLSHELPPLSSSCQEKTCCPIASSSLLLVSSHLPFFVAQPSSCPPQSFSAFPLLDGSPPLFA